VDLNRIQNRLERYYETGEIDIDLANQMHFDCEKLLGEVRRLNDVNIREEVQWFSREMEKKLVENDHKAHWSELPVAYLEMRLKQEVEELEKAIMDFHLGKGSAESVVKEAADAGNFAMMIADAYSHRPRILGKRSSKERVPR
jgi:hypothetical protein